MCNIVLLAACVAATAIAGAGNVQPDGNESHAAKGPADAREAVDPKAPPPALEQAQRKPHGEGARVIAEFGIGTNPSARLQGNIITDEKVAGTIHVAIGRNDFLGGKNIAPTHIDGVVSQPTVWVDGKLLLDKGRQPLQR